MGKIKEHLDSYMHVYDNGTTARLYATPWDRNTVADGYWQTVNTIQPLINRDVYLADCIEELSANAARYEAGSGISFSVLSDGTTQINASMAFGLSGSNGIAVNENAISLSGGTITAGFKFQNLSANNLSAGETNLQTVTSVNHSAQNLTATNSNITNITATTITSTNLSTTYLTATNASAKNFSGTNISANKFSANSAQFNDISAKNFSANKFSAESGMFNNLTATNMTAFTLSSTNLTSVDATITGLSANSISATNISSTNVSGVKFSATYLSAKSLTSNLVEVDNRITTNCLSVTGGRNAFSVSDDIEVYAGGTTKESLSAVLSNLSTKITNVGKCYAQIGVNEASTDIDYYTDQKYATNQSELINQGYFRSYDYVNRQCSLNYDLTSAVERGVSDYIIRSGGTYSDKKLYDESIIDNWFIVGKGLSFNVTAFKPYITYNIKTVPLCYCNMFESFTGVSFYVNDTINNFFIYNLKRTPLSNIIMNVDATSNTEVYRQMCSYKNQRPGYDVGYKWEFVVSNTTYKDMIVCSPTATNDKVKNCVRYMDARGAGTRVTIPLAGDSVFDFVNNSLNHASTQELPNKWLIDWYDVSSNYHGNSAITNAADFVNRNKQLMLGIERIYAYHDTSYLVSSDYNKMREYYGNGAFTFNILYDENNKNVYLYCLNDYTTSGNS